MLAAPGKELDPEERAILDKALYETYTGAGIRPGDPDPWGREAPLLGDLAARLEQMPGRVAASLAVRLSLYATGSLAGLFNRRTNVDLDGRFVVFSIQRLDKKLQPLAIHTIASYVWGRIRRSRRPRRLVVDEGWKLLQHPAGADFLQAMYRQARKYELGVDLITHRAEDLRNSEHGDAILANAAVKVVLRQTETTIDAVAKLFELTEWEERYLLGARKGEGLFFARGGRIPLRVVASPAEDELATSDPRQIAALEAAAHVARDAANRGNARRTSSHPGDGEAVLTATATRSATSVGYRPAGGAR